MESYSLKVPEGRWEDLLNFMKYYGIKENVPFDNGVIKLLIRGYYIALDINSVEMEKQKKEMIEEYISTYYDEDTVAYARIDKDDYIEIKELLRHEFDRIVRDISKEDYLDIVTSSSKVYDSVYFRDLIIENFKFKEFFEKTAKVGFAPNDEVIYKGDIFTDLTDNIDSFHSMNSSYDENAEMVSRIASLTNSNIIKYSKGIILSNACTEVVIYDNTDIALSNYVVKDRTKKRMNIIGNKERIYIADLYDKLSDEKKEKLAEEKKEDLFGPETSMFYQFCVRYAFDENNFKEDKDEFNRILGNLIQANKYVRK